MALETGTYISDFVLTNPTGADDRSTADDHLRLIKSFINATFPNVTGAVTATHTELNLIDGFTGSTADLNLLSGLVSAGLTNTELGYVRDVTSLIQAQIDGKQPLDTDLTTLAGLAKTNSNFIVGNGTNWTVESDTTVRMSLGLGAIALVDSIDSAQIDTDAVTMTELQTAIGTYATTSLGTAGTFTTGGYYAMSCTTDDVSLEYQAYINGSWVKMYDLTSVQSLQWIISGSFRIWNSTGFFKTLTYQKFIG